MAHDLMDICFMMKDAAFAAGDTLTPGQGAESIADDAAASVLLERWFAAGHDDVVMVRGSMMQIARWHGQQYSIEDFAGNMADYTGPAFFVKGLCGAGAYMRGLTGYCVAVAFVDGGRLSASAVYDPVHVAFFHAADGLGAYRNGARISVSSVSQLPDAAIAIGPSVLKTADMRALRRLVQAAAVSTEQTCNLALCQAACGRYDGVVCIGGDFADVAAGCLIAGQAGAALMTLRGGVLEPKPGTPQGMTAAAPGIASALSAMTAKL